MLQEMPVMSSGGGGSFNAEYISAANGQTYTREIETGTLWMGVHNSLAFIYYVIENGTVTYSSSPNNAYYTVSYDTTTHIITFKQTYDSSVDTYVITV